MINSSLGARIFYLLSIVLFSLLINLGTALDDVLMRLKQPLFRQIFLATVVLLYGYVYLIQKLYYYLFFSSPYFVKLKPHLQAFIFVFLSTGSVIFIHVQILNLLLAQRNKGTVFTFDYFKTDFWFLAIPLLVYVLVLYCKPHRLLFIASKMNYKQMLNAEESVEIIPIESPQPAGINSDHELLKLWRESRVMLFVFDYFQLLLRKESFRLDNNNPLWKVVILEKTEFMTFGYFVNGEKWGINHFDDTILTNPWMMKISRNYYVNMLYIVQKLEYRHILKKTNAQVKESRRETVVLNEEIKTKLLAVMDENKLNELLIISRRMKEKNYHIFWESANLEALDENRLEDTIGGIDR